MLPLLSGPVRHRTLPAGRAVGRPPSDKSTVGALYPEPDLIDVGSDGPPRLGYIEPAGRSEQRDLDREELLEADAIGAAETEHAIEAEIVPHADADLVRGYLQQIGRVKLLTAAQEVVIGREIEAGQRDLLLRCSSPSGAD